MFNFKGYDTLYVAPATSTAKVHDDEQRLLDWTKQTLPIELSSSIGHKEIFDKVVTNETDAKPGGKTLNLDTTIVEYSKDGQAYLKMTSLAGSS